MAIRPPEAILGADGVAPMLAQAEEHDRDPLSAQRLVEVGRAGEEGEQHDAGDAVGEEHVDAP